MSNHLSESPSDRWVLLPMGADSRRSCSSSSVPVILKDLGRCWDLSGRGRVCLRVIVGENSVSTSPCLLFGGCAWSAAEILGLCYTLRHFVTLFLQELEVLCVSEDKKCSWVLQFVQKRFCLLVQSCLFTCQQSANISVQLREQACLLWFSSI